MKKLVIIFFTITFLSIVSIDAFSQCAMCRRVAETSQSEENKSAKGLNAGILYLLAIPYVLGGVGVFVWYKNRKKD